MQLSVIEVLTGVFVLTNAAPNRRRCEQHDFEEQVLCRLRQLKTPEECAHARTTCPRLQDILRTRWKDVVVSPVGSTVTGLATKNSDIDCYISIPGYNASTQAQTLEDITRILKLAGTYSKVRSKVYNYRGQTIGVCSFFDNVNQQDCDINFDDYTAPADSRMRAYYFNLDKRFLKLAALIKFWVKSRPYLHKVASRQLRYGAQLMVIFYLQQKDIAPPFYKLQRRKSNERFQQWDTNFDEIEFTSSSSENLYELLGGFFKYYSEFNFKDYVVSPFFGRPVHKQQFKEISTLPDAFAEYKSYLNTEGSTPLLIDSSLCIQQVFIKQRNAVEFLNNETVFVSDLKFASRMFDELPSHKFLDSIYSIPISKL